MKGLASNAQSVHELFPAPSPALDQLRWSFSCQAGWDLETDPALQPLLSQAVKQSTRETGMIISPGFFSALRPHFPLDEWTYLQGFPPELEPAAFAALNRSLDPPIDEAYQARILENRVLWIMWIDGWWEIFPQEHPALAGVKIGGMVAETDFSKWIKFQTDAYQPIHVDFDGPNLPVI